MASGTSAAFPSPTPACPCSSPTTTSAAKLNRFAPFVTFATRLIQTAFSTVRLTPAGSTFLIAIQFLHRSVFSVYSVYSVYSVDLVFPISIIEDRVDWEDWEDRGD